MKPEELFKGAWVTARKWPENIFKVTEIGDKFVYGITATGSVVGPFLFEEIRPILPTPKILEKIGFKDCQYWHELICGDAIIQMQLSHIRMRNGERKFESDLICSIHELQVALRLCGIEKKVVL